MEHKEFRVRIPWPTIHWPRSPLSTWLPSRGNVLFTLVMIAVLLWAQAAGAVSFLAPATRNSPPARARLPTRAVWPTAAATR